MARREHTGEITTTTSSSLAKGNSPVATDYALIKAAETGNLSHLNQLLAQGANPNATDQFGNTALIKAARYGHNACAKALLAHPNIDPNASSDYYADTALILAAAEGQTACVEILLAHPNIEPNATDQFGNTALIKATRYYYETACVEVLLTHPRIDPNASNQVGDTALILAAAGGQTACVEILLAHPNIEPNASSGYYADTALMKAARYRHNACAKALLAHPNIEPNASSRHGDTALILAAAEGQTACVEILLAHPNIEQNASNQVGDTALIKATRYYSCVEVLLTHPRIDPNASNQVGDTALMEAVHHRQTACVEILLAHPNIDPNASNQVGDTALMKAARYRQTACVEALLTHPNIDPNASNQVGDTALHYGCQEGHLASVALLLANGADKNQKNIKQTALTLGNSYLRKECIKMLEGNYTPLDYLALYIKSDLTRSIQKCLDEHPNLIHEKSNAKGSTALHFAAYYGRSNLVQHLLANGADPWAQNNNDKTPLTFAIQTRKYNHSEMHDHKNICFLVIAMHVRKLTGTYSPDLFKKKSGMPQSLALAETYETYKPIFINCLSIAKKWPGVNDQLYDQLRKECGMPEIPEVNESPEYEPCGFFAL